MCKPEEMLGAIRLINHLGKACFIQGLHNEWIPTIVHSRGKSVLLLQALEEEEEEEEEGILFSIREKSGAGGNSIRCTNFIRLGHTASKYMSKGRLCPANMQAVMSFVSCLKCG